MTSYRLYHYDDFMFVSFDSSLCEFFYVYWELTSWLSSINDYIPSWMESSLCCLNIMLSVLNNITTRCPSVSCRPNSVFWTYTWIRNPFPQLFLSSGWMQPQTVLSRDKSSFIFLWKKSLRLMQAIYSISPHYGRFHVFHYTGNKADFAIFLLYETFGLIMLYNIYWLDFYPDKNTHQALKILIQLL